MKLRITSGSDFISLAEKYQVPLLSALMVALLLVPFMGLGNYIMRVFCLVFIYSILTLSLNVVTGWLGATSMGHAALFCVGAYAGAIVATRLNLGIWPALAVSLLVGVLVGTFLGVCTIKLSGSYMTVTTLAFAQVVTMVGKNWTSLTNGTLGIKNIPEITLFGVEMTLKNGGVYYFGLFLLVACVVFTAVIMKSKFGRAFIAIRDDELSARMMGLNTKAYKVLGVAISGGLAGVVGCYYAFLTGYIDPNSFSFDISMTILTMAIFGGLASIPGSIIGAAALTVFPEVLRSLDIYRYLFFGFILVIMMRIRPQGILGGVKAKEYHLPKGVVCIRRKTRGAAPAPETEGGSVK